MDGEIVQLHPITYRLIEEGHPWILKDSFTKRFPQKENVLSAIIPKSRKRVYFLHDIHHPQIVGRVWAIEEKMSFGAKNVKKRFVEAVQKRLKADYFCQRENVYLVFGEADFLPGLFVLKLKNVITFQVQCSVWTSFQDLLNNTCAELFPQEKLTFLWQKRDKGEKNPSLLTETAQELILKEFQIGYKINFSNEKDYGIFTDMSSIRSILLQRKNSFLDKNVLNLFCHTGAFSLLALDQGAKKVVSVDLGKKYLQLLEENIGLNSHLKSDLHQSVCQSVENYLKSEKNIFDRIICDPPPIMTIGGKKINSLNFYQKYLEAMVDLLSEEGEIILFSNLHHMPREKFLVEMNRLIKDISSKKKWRLILKDHYSLGEDCPVLKNFPEGDYLKGISYGRQL